MSSKLITRPAGVLTVPFGVVDVCQAGTSLTEPQSNLTVPPRFGSRTSTPSSPSSPASSTIATTGAPVRLAIATVSPMWSAWPWVSRIVVAATSSALIVAFGLPVRNGSIRRVVSPSESVEARVAEKANVHFVQSSSCRFRVSAQLPRQLEPDRDADEHPQPGLLGEQRLHRPDPLGGVVVRRPPHEPPGCAPMSNQPPSASAVASTRCSEGAARATRSCARRSRSGSAIAAIAASSSASVYARSTTGAASDHTSGRPRLFSASPSQRRAAIRPGSPRARRRRPRPSSRRARRAASAHHDRDHGGAEQVAVDVLAGAERRADPGSPRRSAAPARRRWRPAPAGASSTAAVDRGPADGADQEQRSSTSSGPCRRSSSQPYSAIAPSATNA